MESNVLTMANVIDERELIESAAQIAQEKCTREAVLLATGNVAQVTSSGKCPPICPFVLAFPLIDTTGSCLVPASFSSRQTKISLDPPILVDEIMKKDVDQSLSVNQ